MYSIATVILSEATGRILRIEGILMEEKDLKILICDDSLLARRSLKENLASLNITSILEVTDGQSAVDTYKSEHPDIVFLDIVMPVKDGIQTVKEIMEFDEKACIIMVSSVGTQANLKEALKAGAQDFIQKPATFDQLKSVITTVIKSSL